MDRSKLISVVLVDEYPLFRKAMADLLNATGEFQVLGQTGEGDTALGLSSLGPDIVVMSLEAEEYSALDLLKEIKYRQPATREGVRAIRGVNSDSAISSLVDKGLVREVGKREGGALMYGTTQAFLEKFGLRSPRDLPPLEDFAPDEETRRIIRERLSGQQPTDETAGTEQDEDALEEYPEEEDDER